MNKIFLMIAFIFTVAFGQDSSLIYFDIALAKIKADSIKQADSTRQLNSTSKVVDDSVTMPTVEAKKAVDSIAEIFVKDSIIERQQAMVIFKKQLNLNKSISVQTKLECIEFLVINDLRTPVQVETYLACLSKLCQDKQNLFYAARLTVTQDQKYLCVLYFKKARDDCSKVELARIRIR